MSTVDAQPLKVVVIPGLTLPTLERQDIERIRTAAGPSSEVLVCDYAAAAEQVADCDVILGVVPQSLFAQTSQLRWVQSISSGVDAFMYREFVESSVTLTSEKGLVGEHLADHGFGLLLMLTRQLAAARDLGAQAWQHRPALRAAEIELTGATMGIVGFGGTGQAMAKRAQAFGMQVRAIDRDEIEPRYGVDEVEHTSALVSMLSASDVVAVCCPLTKETNKLFNTKTLGTMKPGSYLVNVTRGEVIDEDALVDALQNGHLAGAGLDVAPREPLPPESALWSCPNIVMTPHTAGASQYRAQRNLDRFIDNLERFRAGKTLQGVIDKTLGY